MPQNPQQNPSQLATQVMKASTATTVGGSLLLLSGLTLTAAVIGLAAATPLLVLFSPVLVPVTATAMLLAAGFAVAGGMGSTATYVFYRTYKFVAGKRPMGSDELGALTLASKEADAVGLLSCTPGGWSTPEKGFN